MAKINESAVNEFINAIKDFDSSMISDEEANAINADIDRYTKAIGLLFCEMSKETADFTMQPYAYVVACMRIAYKFFMMMATDKLGSKDAAAKILMTTILEMISSEEVGEESEEEANEK